jgi:uncharacterized protein (DUF885 family)
MFAAAATPFGRWARHARLAGLVALTVALAASSAGAASPDWVQRSNANAQVLLNVMAKYSPEGAARFGVSGLDDQIFDLSPGFVDRQLTDVKGAITNLEGRLATEKDPPVRQDLEILINAAKTNVEGTELNRKLVLPYFSVSATVYQGLQALLDDQIAPERRAAALVRLRKYAGVEKGYTPIAKLAEARIRERMAVTGLIGPVKDEVDRELGNEQTYVDGIAKLFQKYQLKDWEKPYEELKRQLVDYNSFVRAEILPRARTDFRQPQELYAYSLRESGIDMPIPELMSRAEVAFEEIQTQMQCLAPLVAKEKGLTVTDYRDVIRELKKQQLVGEAILPAYQKRMKDLERIIRDHKICTLPQREAKIELSSEAESAAIPAPHMRPPRLIGNTGESGVFVLPLRIPGKDKQLAFDDFTCDAASWTLTAHEGRPGHELQFAAMIERGVSLARALFAFNSVNAEGWALYAEAEAQPYEPLDGQMFTLQFRLMRAARAFLDPGLQTGTITKDEATRILRDEVGLSEAMALQEVERYTFRAPGQAPSYFTGYSRLLETRSEAQRKLGPQFDRMRFNDFVLAQGMLPPALLKKAVMEDFVPQQTASK